MQIEGENVVDLTTRPSWVELSPAEKRKRKKKDKDEHLVSAKRSKKEEKEAEQMKKERKEKKISTVLRTRVRKLSLNTLF